MPLWRRAESKHRAVIAAATSWRRDAAATLLLLSLAMLWDVSGGDWIVTQHYGQATGFALRHAVWAERLHDAGRWLAAAAWLALLAWAAGPARTAQARATTLAAAASVLIAALLVAAIKHASGADCPWNLQAFGGENAYLSHWTTWAVGDGAGAGITNPGRCFPSGHASAAFAFLPVYALCRVQHPRFAQLALAATLVLGLAYGWLQVARGAHFVSHVLWSAWLCWLVAMAAPLLLRCMAGHGMETLRATKRPTLGRRTGCR
jgi:membrane-associated PAP2 superfamily phosphatase